VNTVHYPKEFLKSIQTIAVKNSLAMTQMKMYGFKCKIQLDIGANKLLPSVKVEKLDA